MTDREALAESVLAPRGRCVICDKPIPRTRPGPAKTCGPRCAKRKLRRYLAARIKWKRQNCPEFAARQYACQCRWRERRRAAKKQQEQGR